MKFILFVLIFSITTIELYSETLPTNIQPIPKHTIKITPSATGLTSITFNLGKNTSKNIVLKKIPKYNLKVSIFPKNTIMILTNIDTKKEFIILSGVSKRLFRGNYSYKLKREGYSFDKEIKSIKLDKDKTIKIKMVPNYIKYLRPYLLTDLNMGVNSLYPSLGAGVDLLDFIKGGRSIKTGLSFNYNLTDNYIYFDFYLESTWNIFIQNFNAGLSLSYLLGREVNALSPSFSIEYKYFLTKNLFLKARVKTGLSILGFKKITYSPFMISGISINLNPEKIVDVFDEFITIMIAVKNIVFWLN